MLSLLRSRLCGAPLRKCFALHRVRDTWGGGGVTRRALRIIAPGAGLALGVLAWDLIVRVNDIPPYILPSPGLVVSTLISDWPILWSWLVAPLTPTVGGLLLAVAGCIGLAVLFNQSRLLELSLYPYAVILQVTPVV